jgi:hypothetical protein
MSKVTSGELRLIIILINAFTKNKKFHSLGENRVLLPCVLRAEAGFYVGVKTLYQCPNRYMS